MPGKDFYREVRGLGWRFGGGKLVCGLPHTFPLNPETLSPIAKEQTLRIQIAQCR